MRWCHDHKHGLTQPEADDLLDLLRACAWAPPGDGPNLTEHYEEALSRLKVWRNHSAVQQWLSTMWIPIPEVKEVNLPVHVHYTKKICKT